MWKLRDKCAIAGIGQTTFTKASGRTVLDLASEACLKAVQDSGLELSEIDGIISFNFNDSVPAIAVASSLGIPHAMHAVDYAAGGNGANLIVLAATAAIEAGLAKNVLVYRAMNGRSGFRLGGGRDMNARGITQYTAPFGWITYPQAMAMWCRRHMIKYGTTSEQLGRVAMTFRENAALNDAAMLRQPFTMDEYLSSRMIVEPLRVLDICLESDGACAVVVTGSEQARDLKQKPVYITGGAYGGGLNQGDDLFDAIRWPDHSRNYAASVLMQLEGFGFCKEGEGGPFVEAGNIARTGSLPTNTHGGLLSEAYIHGFNHVLEAVRQLRHEAGARQVPDAKVALTTAGAMTCGSAMLLRN
jgi:acetyl-CoA acetyltransferase